MTNVSGLLTTVYISKIPAYISKLDWYSDCSLSSLLVWWAAEHRSTGKWPCNVNGELLFLCLRQQNAVEILHFRVPARRPWSVRPLTVHLLRVTRSLYNETCHKYSTREWAVLMPLKRCSRSEVKGQGRDQVNYPTLAEAYISMLWRRRSLSNVTLFQ